MKAGVLGSLLFHDENVAVFLLYESINCFLLQCFLKKGRALNVHFFIFSCLIFKKSRAFWLA